MFEEILRSLKPRWEVGLDGLLDEVRISNTARSEEWINTCFKNQNDPNSFYIIGEEETIGNFQPIQSNPIPLNNSYDVELNPTLSIDIIDTDGNNIEVTFMKKEKDNSWTQIGITQTGSG